MNFPDPDLDWVALLEAQGAGPEKYHMHSSAHTMACQKYLVAAKQAKDSGNAERAKLLRKIGKKHKAAAEALAAIANHHTDAAYGIQLKKKAQLMSKKPVNEDLEDIIQEDQIDELSKGTMGRYIKRAHDSGVSHQASADYYRDEDDSEDFDHHNRKAQNRRNGIRKAVDKLTREDVEVDLEDEVIEEEIEIDPVRVLIEMALYEKPLDFSELVHGIIAERVSSQLEDLKVTIQEALVADADGSADDEEDEDSKESPEIQGESVEIDEGTEPPSNEYRDLDKSPNKWLKTKKSVAKKPWRSEASKSLDKYKGRFSEAYRYATTEPGPEGHGTRPPMPQEKEPDPTASAKKFPTGRQDGDAGKLPKIGTKKKSQKGTTVAAGDTVRTQRAAD